MDSDNLFYDTFLELARKRRGAGGLEVDFHEEMRDFNNLKMFENFPGTQMASMDLKEPIQTLNLMSFHSDASPQMHVSKRFF